ncbi:MAG: ABC transporter ATP-binding protein, partial [Pikeienuella sp.]
IDRPALEADGLIAGYGPTIKGRPVVTTLDNVSFSLEAGKVLAVIGESGSGKTTLAKVLAGLHPPTQGRTLLKGEALRALSAQRSLEERRRVQLVFQMADTALNPRHMVGRVLGRAIRFYHGCSKDEAQAEVRRLLTMVQLPPDYAGRLVRRLSGGEKQRVNLARALAAQPEVVICDEITSALDTVVARSIIELIDRLRIEMGLAVIFVSHDLAAVADLADDILVMRRGRTVAYGSAVEILSNPADPYVRLLIASAPELRIGWLEEAAATRVALQDKLKAM